jgi:peptidoglycan/LPS O-acetylase OafA/YrhL
MTAGATTPDFARKKSPGTGHLPSLDGLRAISISMVLLGHLDGTRGAVLPDPGVGDYAHLGVTVFFVISGFLITRLLSSEHAKKGRISLKLFYTRRALRLFPASFAYIACICLLWLAGMVHLRATDIWHAVTYTVNYLPQMPWEIGHLWSLSVEEQFYLLWPFAFLALGPRRATWTAAAVILLGPLARLADRLFLTATPYHALPMFPMVADSLAVGCVLANASAWLEQREWYLKLFRPAAAVAILASILLINRYAASTLVTVFGTSAVNIGIAILVHRSVYCSRDWLGKALNWKPVAFVGVLSYSLYLWQQIFLDRRSAAWINAFPQNLVCAAAAATASYFLLERPLLRLRRRLRP